MNNKVEEARLEGFLAGVQLTKAQIYDLLYQMDLEWVVDELEATDVDAQED